MSSSLYVTNTAFGYVMMLALGIAAVAIQNEVFRAALADPSIRRLLIAVPLALGVITAMSATTGSAISMEGKQFWIVRTMPIPAKDLFISKILVSMTLAVPSIILTGTLLGIGLKMEAAMWPWLYITPLVCALFAAVFGLSVNLALPKLDWTNEAEVVKQSAAMAAAMFGGMGCMLVPTVLVAVLGLYWLLPLATLVLLGVTAMIWQRLLKRGEKRLSAI
jgi:ABC-2 type transport system permease protein